ncbi:protein of unknown function [Burkholderia multivorans]
MQVGMLAVGRDACIANQHTDSKLSGENPV